MRSRSLRSSWPLGPKVGKLPRLPAIEAVSRRWRWRDCASGTLVCRRASLWRGPLCCVRGAASLTVRRRSTAPSPMLRALLWRACQLRWCSVASATWPPRGWFSERSPASGWKVTSGSGEGLMRAAVRPYCRFLRFLPRARLLLRRNPTAGCLGRAVSIVRVDRSRQECCFLPKRRATACRLAGLQACELAASAKNVILRRSRHVVPLEGL
mmetsp:Transcript_78355/g.227359  ORF Transcript_78355/g.227359 Transcript_78355/m.227359 type:complete len:211 (+) Transcript_78355:911-1543(+)